MSDTGFGDPPPPGWDEDPPIEGFGDATPPGWEGDPGIAGFGEPAVALGPYILFAGDLIPDEGGTVVEIISLWADVPHRVQVVDADGNLYPETDYAYGTVIGQGVDLTPTASLQRIRFATPPLPPGVYDIRVYWGPAFGQSIDIEEAFRVIRRGRVEDTYRIRKMLPRDIYNTGTRSIEEERVLDAI
jgi:hypothetical protein